jgi:hypothetical protein
MISVTPRLHFGEPSSDGVSIDIETNLPNEAAAFILLGFTVLVPDADTAKRALAFLMPEEQAISRVDSVLNFDVTSIPTWQG